ncbi:MAG: DNA ligase-associated DEXH box helicase, partial [Janthinobacterium lividum]
WSYRDLTALEWQWTLDFVARGGQSLVAYPEYQRVLADENGRWRVPNRAIALRHRMSIGTIVSDASIEVKFISGGRVGSVEESFISRMKPGDHFLFGGRMLEFVRVHEMFAYVRRATGKRGIVPRWSGGKMALSAQLGEAALAQLEEAGHGELHSPEMRALAPLLAVQQRWSSLPTTDHLVIESMHSREGWHLFMYPFAGRSVHMGLAALLAWRIACRLPSTLSIAVNDYGLELLCATPLDYRQLFAAGQGTASDLLSTTGLLDDVLASLNAGELAQRRFREIARIAGLVFQGYPGKPKSQRQVQASSSLFFEVFRKHDSGNLLLSQAQREVLEQELESTQLRQTLERMSHQQHLFFEIKRATPFAFPLMVERFREKLSTEKLSERVARMVRELEKAATP